MTRRPRLRSHAQRPHCSSRSKCPTIYTECTQQSAPYKPSGLVDSWRRNLESIGGRAAGRRTAAFREMQGLKCTGRTAAFQKKQTT